jgi:DNA ligase-1
MKQNPKLFTAIVVILLHLMPLRAAYATTSAETVKPPVMLAMSYDGVSDPTGWWISEKLDGVRGYWTGNRMVTRTGHVLPAPPWFTGNFPDFPLDGELWIGHGRFSETTAILRKSDDNGWKQIRYCVFDAPSDAQVFEKRIEKAETWFETHPSPYVHILEQTACEGKKHLQTLLEKTEKKGGEGLMLRRPESLYTEGRSPGMLKVKSFEDTEAIVIGHREGTGKYRGKMGSLRVELPGGKRFSIGTGFTDKDRENPPPVGATVTFRYKGLTVTGLPRFASFMRVRDDL